MNIPSLPIAPRVRLFAALRDSFARGYGPSDLRADALAGLVVGLVALPLSMALAVATGVAPQYGLYTAVVAGVVTALLGGSRVQVSGPTAAFVVVLAPITSVYGLGGLAVASAMAGVILMLMGAARLGRLIQLIPHPVVTGFTTGIAVVIASLQLEDLLGLTLPSGAEHFAERISAVVTALPTTRWEDLSIGLGTLALLILWPRVSRRVPAPLVALALAALAAEALAGTLPGFHVATIESRFGGIPQAAPAFALPWDLPGPDGRPLGLSFDLVRALAVPAFAIAMLGAIESLLSAVIADGLTGDAHDPDAELVAQGAGNLLAPFFGGFASTGALARTATNVRAGARSPVAAVVHALFVLVTILALAPLLGALPMASLAALLLVVAWNMSEVRHFVHVARIAPRSDVLVLLTCFGLTVAFDMVVAVSAGVLLAALLFMRRMVEVFEVRLLTEGRDADPAVADLPDDVMVYAIAGPLFFGAAQKAMGELAVVGGGPRCLVLDLRAVPAIDATGLVNLVSLLERLAASSTKVILAGLQPQPARVLAKAGVTDRPGRLRLCASLDEAVAVARQRSQSRRTGSGLARPSVA